jgi:molybdopterin-containing oxidoreductase family iron-sulfur binding subunit
MTDGTVNERSDLVTLRSRLEATRGREYWRSLESLVETPEFKELLHREFPQNASEWLDPSVGAAS